MKDYLLLDDDFFSPDFDPNFLRWLDMELEEY